MVRIARFFPMFALAGLLAFPLGGCAPQVQQFKTTVSNVVGVVTSTKIDRKKVYIAAQTANTFIIGTDIYLSLGICGPSKPPCRDIRATETLIAAQQSAASARNAMLQFMLDNPKTLGDAGLYINMVTAYNELKRQMDIWGVKPSPGASN